ncbi:MAG TPA: 3-oxoacyl-[acyl-carrier-protein] reductase [Candidatus Krumholzibacteria bacterium]|nr:3-oxoacyl-[acyl-carrier-protein] reductase [Candidatus Krumholzibacteria bacterium]HPD71490.1 3-oxoacyl-[acyl-carrier-protein] reductase [Candidatus Krumholzibacteria bacterium]HRY41577.1 3-oxoacyl-[acyl-carrier-protein] reductase [Candidatus Krumholzibacteria bacterium]
MAADGVVIVTGANRGIGRGLAADLARTGWPVALVGRSLDKLQEAARDLPSAAVARCYAADVSQWEDVQAVVAAIQADFPAIHGLVNNAGITRDGLVVRMSPEDWQAVINVNLNGTFYFTRSVAPIMMRQRAGRIVNISSVIGLIGNAGQANYAASKAAIVAMTKSVARELGGRGVTCNAIAPGFIETDMTAGLPEKVRADMLQRIPLKRLGRVEDLAGVVRFLLSPDAAWITGQTLVVDGGMVM